jgi:hypothetical protein
VGTLGRMAVLAVALLVGACAGSGRPVVTSPSPVRPGTSPARSAKPGPAWIITTGSLPRLAAAGLPVPVLDADRAEHQPQRQAGHRHRPADRLPGGPGVRRHRLLAQRPPDQRRVPTVRSTADPRRRRLPACPWADGGCMVMTTLVTCFGDSRTAAGLRPYRNFIPVSRPGTPRGPGHGRRGGPGRGHRGRCRAPRL